MPTWARHPRQPRAGRALSALGEPAHVLSLFVGLVQQDNETPVTRGQLRGIARLLESRFGAYTVVKGRGRWRHPATGVRFNEPTYIFTVVRVTGTCADLRTVGKSVARTAARTANQAEALLLTTCSSGHVEADFVSAS